MLATQAWAAETIEIDSLKALAEYAKQDKVNVRLLPGTYQLKDPAMGQLFDMSEKPYGFTGRNPKSVSYLYFSGSDSTYDLTGAKIEMHSKLNAAYGYREIYEVFVSGHRNTIKGLTLHDIGNTAAKHRAKAVCIIGNDNTLEGADLYVHGSTPYGYGHLLGKGAGAFVPLRKHSGILVCGERNKIIGCKVKQHAFGHAIVMQAAVDTLIKDCYVEGEMRTTDEMLAETEGLAFNVGFKSHYPPGKIMPGQIKALAEDGIRTYPNGAFFNTRRTGPVEVINCVVKNMRSAITLGFEQGPSKISNCTVIDYQERGYSIGTNGVISNCKGDAMYGPLLTFLGSRAKNCEIDLILLPETSNFPVPRLLEINGTGHHIRLRNAAGTQRDKPAPIVFGESEWGDIHLFRAPDSAPSKYSGAYKCTLENETGMPIIFSELSQDCLATTTGTLQEDRGQNNRVQFMNSNKSQLIERLESGQRQTLVTYGTSLTANGAWVEQLKATLEARYPDQLTLMNSGGSGKHSEWGLEQLEKRVLQHQPNTVFLEFSINDAVARFNISVDAARSNLETMIDRILETNANCEVILMTMTPGNKYPDTHRSHRANIEAHYDMYRTVAKERGLLLIDHFPNWKALQNSEPQRFKQYIPDTIHPNTEGCTVMVTPTILAALGNLETAP